MKFKMTFFACCFMAVYLSACGTSEIAIQTALAQTARANPSSTWVPTAVETFSPVPTLSPTPDTRVINVDPRVLLLEIEDIPVDGQYFLPGPEWISPHRNSEIVSGWGVEEGREYLDRTGRVDGWIVIYRRGTSRVLAPEEIYNNVVLFKSADGARLLMADYSFCTDTDFDYSVVETDIQIGDKTIVCTFQEMQPSGEPRVWLRLDFVYRNVYHGLVYWGWDYEVGLDMLEENAQRLLARLKEQPLSTEVTFNP